MRLRRVKIQQKNVSALSSSTILTALSGKFEKIKELMDYKLSSINAWLSQVDIFHKEFQALWESLEFSQTQVKTPSAHSAAD